MKIYFDYPIIHEVWGGGAHFLSNFAEFLEKKGHQLTFKLDKKIDLIFIIGNTKKIDKKLFKYLSKNPGTKVLHRINECDKRKNTDYIDKLVFEKNKIAHQSVFISKWLSEYYIEKGFNKSYEIVYNGCNQSHFYPEQNKRFGEKINVVTHHWSNNWLKGFDIYTKIDEVLNERKNFLFTYIGRYFEGYTPKNTKIIPPLYGKELGTELRKYDIYLTASRWEPCGMHHIEGASCGLPVLYHKDGGGINESCQQYGIEYNNIDSLLEGIQKIKERYYEYRNKIPYKFLSSERCCEQYYKIILELFN